MASFYRPGFRVSHCVKDPKLLFGWNAPGMLLDVAVGKIEAGDAFMVRGERRSGKTSFLSCLKALVYAECQGITVSSVDFSCISDITDAFSAHKYIFEKVLRSLWDDERISWMPDSLDLNRFHFTRNNLDNSFTQLDGEYSIQECLKMLDSLLKRHNHRLFIFFDEYESMHRAFGGGTSYFNTYRELQQHSEKGGISCIIAGAESTRSFSGRTGSPQFNLFEPIYLGTIARDAFYALWKHCLDDCSPQCRERVQAKMATIEGGIDGIYELCGGRPAYAKALGAFWTELGDGTPPRLIQWFEDILNRLSRCDNNSKAVLFTIARGRSLNRLNVVRKNEILDDLRQLNLIRKNDEDPTGLPWCINGKLWQEFLISRYEDEPSQVNLSVASAQELHDGYSMEGRDRKGIITDGHSLARWFLGHRDFSTTILQDYRETDWLEFKRAFYWNTEPAHTGDGQEYFPGLCRECGRRPHVKAHENCWSNCTKRNEVNWKVSEAVIAIANSGGGVLLLGIDDNLPDVGYIPASLRDGVKDKEEFIRDRLRPEILPEDGEWIISSNWRWRIAEESLGDYRVWRDSVYFDEKKAVDGSLYAAIFIAPRDKPLLVQELRGQNSTTVCLGRAVGEGRVTRYDTLVERVNFTASRTSFFTCKYYREEADKLLRDYLEPAAEYKKTGRR